MSIVRNAIVILEKGQIPIFKDTIAKVLESQKKLNTAPKDMLKHVEKLSKEARLIIEKEINLLRPQ